MAIDAKPKGWPAPLLAAAIAVLAVAGAAHAQGLAGPGLVKALRQGGYVVVMRHTRSPQQPPAQTEAEPDNLNRERQLDDVGRQSAAAMGAAVKALRIPVGDVWSSPAYRALQTVRLAGLPTPKIADPLGDRGQSMQAANDDQSAWLKARAAQAPPPGTDTLIVTHYPNIAAAFGEAASGVADGEAIVFRPAGDGRLNIVGRIKIEDWAVAEK
jgi:phosphohistidine phosphatase SixA